MLSCPPSAWAFSVIFFLLHRFASLFIESVHGFSLAKHASKRHQVPLSNLEEADLGREKQVFEAASRHDPRFQTGVLFPFWN
jgi:hypothetical protein